MNFALLIYANSSFLQFIRVYFRLSKMGIKSKLERFNHMNLKLEVKQWKLLTISTKHLAKGLSMNVQLDISSKNFVNVERASKMRIADTLLQLTTNS